MTIRNDIPITEDLIAAHGLKPDEYQRILDLIDAWQHENLLRPSRNAPDLYVMKLMLKGLKPGTIAIKLASARTLYAALTWAGAVERDPFKGVKGPPDLEAPWDKRRPYTEEEVSRLLTKSRAVDRVLVLLGAHAGLRVAEAVDLLWTDVDLDARELKVRHGKAGRPRTVAVSAGLARALADLQAITSRDRVLGYTTTTRARARMRRLAFRALVPYRGVHALRHACGTRMAREKGLEAAQHHLGHQNLATTQVYAKWNQDEIRSTVGAWE